MKNIKKSIYYFLILNLIGIVSCQTDPCKNSNCLNGATCVDGECVCASGYTGSHCENAPPDTLHAEFFFGYGAPSYMQHVKIYMDGVSFAEFTRSDIAPSSYFQAPPNNYGILVSIPKNGSHTFSAEEINTGIKWQNIPVMGAFDYSRWELTPFGTFFNWGLVGSVNPANEKFILYQESNCGPTQFELEKDGWLMQDDYVASGTSATLDCNNPKAFRLFYGQHRIYVRPKGIDSANYPNLRWSKAWYFNNGDSCNYFRLNCDGTITVF